MSETPSGFQTSNIGQWVDVRPEKFQISDPIASPDPSQVSAEPAFTSGTGTKADPYIVDPVICATQGLDAISSQKIKITGQNPTWRVYFKDQSNLADTDRFRQQIGTVDTSGNYSTFLIYRDRPTTTTDGIVYTGLLEVGSCWLSWNVTQQVTVPISENTKTTISNIDGSIYRVNDTIQMTPGTITGGVPGPTGYEYFYYWERSDTGRTGTFTKITNPSTDVSAQQYKITTNDYGKFIRAVTLGVDSTTPVNQELAMPSGPTNGIAAAPFIESILLTDDGDNTIDRFTSEPFTTTYTLSTLGSENTTMGLKIYCALPDGVTILYPVFNAAGTITDLGLPDPGFVTMTDQTSPTVTFPATLALSALTPDDVLPKGTLIKSEIQVSNSYGSVTKLSNGIIPVDDSEVTIPPPETINGFIQYDDEFIADQTPFNTGVPLGSYKNTYSFIWSGPAEITFVPTWDVSSTPIAQVQGGGVVTGTADFKITFVDGNNASTQVAVNTTNTDWSLPIEFSDYGFTPPTTIKSVKFETTNATDTSVGFINFYEANNQSVIYEKYVEEQNDLTRLKLEALDLVATRATRTAAAIHNLANPSDLKLEAFILPKAGFDSGNIYILHRDRAPGNINISFEVILTNLSTFTLTSTNLSNTGTYDAFLTSLISGLSTDSRVTVAATDGAITITPAATYAIDDIKVSITSGTLSSLITEDVNGTAVGAPTLANTYNITVKNKTGANHTYGLGSLKAYYVAGVEANSLVFTKGLTYRFNQSDVSNTGHPLRLYTDETKTTEYTTGVTTNGTPGSVGAYTQIATVTNAPSTLYYQCSNHTYMGGKITLT